MMARFGGVDYVALQALLDAVQTLAPHGDTLKRLVHELQIHRVALEGQHRGLRDVPATLEASRERYAKLYDFPPVGYLTLDETGLIQQINFTGSALLGVPRARLIGRGLCTLLPPDECTRLRAHLAATLGSRERQTCELRCGDGDGERLLLLESTPDPTDDAALVRSVIMDITGWSAKEVHGRQSASVATSGWERRRLIRGLRRAFGVGGCNFDPDRVLRDVLGAVRDLFAAERAWLLYPCDPDAGSCEIIGETGVPAFAAAAGQPARLSMDASMRGLLQDALDASRPLTVQMACSSPRANGLSSVCTRMVTVIRAQPGPPWLLGLDQCTDARHWDDEDQWLFLAIADRMAELLTTLSVRRALAESEERFRATFEQAAVGIAHLGEDGRFLRVNQTLCDILGYREDEFLRLFCKDLTHPDDLRDMFGYFSRIKSGGSPKPGLEKRCLTRSGELRWCSLTTSVLRRADDEVKYYIAVIEDISERKRIEESAQQQRLALARVGRVSAMGAMASAIAHEMNQHLMAIGNYAGGTIERLRENPRDLTWLPGALQEIAGLAGRAAHVIECLRDFSRNRTPENQPVELPKVVEAARQMLVGEARSRRVRITVSVAARPPRVWGDPIELEQVVINLLLNGMEAMAETVQSQRRLSLMVRGDDEGHVVLEVSDRGCGLPADGNARIFDPLVTTKPCGTGLGLSISRAIIMAHGGQIWARPRPGGGATVGFRLPIDRGDADARA